MREEGVPFRSHTEILTFEEIVRFVRVAAGLGISRVRLTGGEPLVRKNICELVEMLANVPGINDLAMTTNGVLLAECAESLKKAGLQRLNISLDTLDPGKFEDASRRGSLTRVLEGVEAARRVGFRQIKLNALGIRGMTEEDVVPLARFANERGLEIRFIEYMPLDGQCQWQPGQVLPGEEILEILSDGIGPLEPIPVAGPQAPATRYRFPDGQGTVGIVPSVSRPFCDQCNRLRLTAEGKIRNCLFAAEESDARQAIRNGATDQQLAELVREAVLGKKQARGSNDGSFVRSLRAMHQIGG
jgi:cyclic pyranopterin phosphate synthase